jgi:hypothetical protein
MSRPKKIDLKTRKTRKRKSWNPLENVGAAKSDGSKETVDFTPDDKLLLEKQERIIASHVGAFLLIGEALSIIKGRDLQLIADSKLTFEQYCEKRWDFGKAYAYRLIAGYECVKRLKEELSPNGVTLFPANEAQVRPLAGLKPEDQVKAWPKVLKRANDGYLTAALVEEVVEEMAGKSKTAKSYRATKTNADAKAEQEKLKTIAKIVDKALQVDLAERTIKELSGVLMKIQELLTGDES